MPDMNNEIDNLKIVVEGESKGVESTLLGIANALRTLRSSLGKDTSKYIGKTTDAIKTLARNVAAIPASDVSKLERLANAMAKLKGIGKVKTGVSVSGGRQVADAVEKLNGGSGEGGSTSTGGKPRQSKEDKERLAAQKKYNEKIKELKKLLGTTKLSNLPSQFFRIAFYRAIRSIIQTITQSFSEGMQHAYQYAKLTNGEYATASKEITASTQYLTNALGAAASELVTTLQPAICAVADGVADIANGFAQMNAFLRGSSTYMKAVKTDAKETSRYLLGFDEINKLGSADYSDSFTYEEVNNGEAIGLLATVSAIGLAIAGWSALKFIEHCKQIKTLITEIGGLNAFKSIVGLSSSSAVTAASGAAGGATVSGASSTILASLATAGTVAAIVALVAAAIGISVYSIKKMYDQVEELNATNTSWLDNATEAELESKIIQATIDGNKSLAEFYTARLDEKYPSETRAWAVADQAGKPETELGSASDSIINIQIGDAALDNYYTKKYSNNLRNIKLPVN